MPAGVIPRARINVFSPLPPVQSEIANHTVTVAAALQAVAEITLWTPQPEPPGPAGGIRIVRYDPANVPWAELNRADANIYNIGNNATFHRAIFDVARRAPGIIVMHDTRLQHFFLRYSENEGADRDFYLDSMRRSHGLAGFDDAQRYFDREIAMDILVDRYPMTAAALDGALAAIVHNAAEAAELAGQTRTPVFHLPLVFAAGPPPFRPARTPGVVLRLIAFGFMGRNRRLESILEALAQSQDRDIRFDIYGSLEEPELVAEQIVRLGLTERVQVHGYVPAEDLASAIASADLALNLRFPSMGEASASQLRIWDAGVPSLVTRTGWYAALPPDTVFFVEPQQEVAGILQHLASLRGDPEPFRQAARRGREMLLERHAPHRYAQALLQIVALSRPLHARCQAATLARAAAQAMATLAGLDGVAAGADPVAEAILALTAAPSGMTGRSG